MDSSNWTKAQKDAAGKRFADRLAESYRNPAFRAKLRRAEAKIQTRIRALNKQGDSK